MNAIKSRIVAHKRLPASSLKAHPLNPRTHPDEQRSVLRQLLEEIGLARSVLAYHDPEWGLTLIDGHLRQEVLGDQEVDVEVLDVTRDEAHQNLRVRRVGAALARRPSHRSGRAQLRHPALPVTGSLPGGPTCEPLRTR